MSAARSTRPGAVPDTRLNGLALLRWIGSGQWRMSPGRAATAVVAVAIGVALGLGIHLVNRSALHEFGAAIAVVNGEAQLSVKAAARGFDESVFPVVAGAPGVEAASPVVEADLPVIDTRAGQEGASGRPSMIRVIGIDAMRAATVTPSLLPAAEGAGSGSAIFGDDTVFLSLAALQAHGLEPGGTLRLRDGLREVSLRIAGSVPGAAAGQRIAVMDIGAAQWRLGWLGRLSRIDLRLAPGYDAQRIAGALAGRLPDDLVWSTPDASRQRMSNLSRAYRINLSVLALVALFTGGFIVYSTMALGVLRQQPELALLGVLGASPRFLVTLVLGQGALLGGIGALLGVAGGMGLARAMLALVGGDLGGGFFQGSTPPLALEPWSLLAFGALGLLVGMAGSLVPALSLRRLAPARALKAPSGDRALARGRNAALAASLFAAGAALVALPSVDGLPLPSYLAIAAWLLAGIVFVPVLTGAFGEALVRVFRSAWGTPVAWFALQRIRGAPSAASAALAGVVASVALATAMAIMVHSFRVSVDQWLDAVLPADLYGRAGGTSANAPLDPDLQRRIAGIRGVERAEFLRALELTLDPARPPVLLLARPLTGEGSRFRLPITGDRLAAPPGEIPIYVSEAMVDLYGHAVGRSIDLPLGAGGRPAARFFVAGVWRDYARQHGSIVIDEADYRALTGDAAVSDVALWLDPAARPESVLEAMRERIPELAAVEFRSAREIRAISLRIFDRSFALTYVLEAIAIVVGLFGVAATYAGEALARAREFGMLRHLGVTRGQIVRMFALESGLLITAGVAWGAVVGVLIAMVLIHRVNPQSFHWTMDVAWPVELLAASAVSLIVLGVGAAVAASRSATGSSPVRAVREDW